jgi:YVTN family beta-propeller protein
LFIFVQKNFALEKKTMKIQNNFRPTLARQLFHRFAQHLRNVFAASAFLSLFLLCQITKADTSIGNVPTGNSPKPLAVNPVTNKIYVCNDGSASVTVINGTNNSTTTVATGATPVAVAVNPATNRIYVTNQNQNTGISTVTVIDGKNNSTTMVAAGNFPDAVVANPVNGKVYIPDRDDNNVTIITPAPTNAIPLNTTVAPLAGNSTINQTPTFTFTATTTYAPNAPAPQNIYYQIDSTNGAWTKATNTGSTATTLTATATVATLTPGVHIIYFFASDGSDATSINPARADFDPESANAPESSLVIGGINAYLFAIAPTTTAASASIGGRVVQANGRGIANVGVALTDANGTARVVKSNSFGYFRFAEIETGQTYVLSANHKIYSFDSQILAVNDNLQGIVLTAINH